MSSPKRVAILHPDLGVGGAERLIVDAARCLAQAGHSVTLFTARHDPARCFPEILDGSFDIRVLNRRFSMWRGQRLRAPLTIADMARLVRVAARVDRPYDVVLCDLVAHILPLVARWMPDARRLFYCHYPDRHLAPPGGLLYRLYRAPINWLEARGMQSADRVLVNSEFTRRATLAAFPRLDPRRMEILHPGVRLHQTPTTHGDNESGPMVLSILRFSPEKNALLLVEVFSRLSTMLPPNLLSRSRLVVAGGYDASLGTNRSTLESMRRKIHDAGLASQITLLPNASSDQIAELLSQCRCVAYPPRAEHFGYVPIEAMAAGKPVVAVDDGGPRETVVDGETGFLCAPTADAFATAIARLLSNPQLASEMGERGPAQAARYSLAAFCEGLTATLE